jgi:hypothetical protein
MALYKYVVPKPREQCTKPEQLTVSFAAGYIAGVFCAVVSHPAGEGSRATGRVHGCTARDVLLAGVSVWASRSRSSLLGTQLTQCRAHRWEGGLCSVRGMRGWAGRQKHLEGGCSTTLRPCARRAVTLLHAWRLQVLCFHWVLAPKRLVQGTGTSYKVRLEKVAWVKVGTACSGSGLLLC